jgi:hypothetical protein
MAECEQCEQEIPSADAPCPKCGHFVAREERLARRIASLQSFHASLVTQRTWLMPGLLSIITTGILVTLFGMVPGCVVDKELLVSPILCSHVCDGCSGPAKVVHWSNGVDSDSGGDFALVCKAPPGVVAATGSGEDGPYAISSIKTMLAYLPLIVVGGGLFFVPFLLYGRGRRKKQCAQLLALIEGLEADLAKLKVGPYRGATPSAS